MKSTIEKFDSGMHYIMLPSDFAPDGMKEKRYICVVGNYQFHCAVMPRKSGGFFINLGAKTLKQIAGKLGDTIEFELKPDHTIHQFEQSEILEEVLKSDPQARQVFHGLSPGNKRSIIYYLHQVKSIDKRIERGLLIAEALKAGITSVRDMARIKRK